MSADDQQSTEAAASLKFNVSKFFANFVVDLLEQTFESEEYEAWSIRLFFAIHARQQGPWRADSQNKNSTDFIIAPCYSILHSLGLSQDSSNLTPTFCQNINRDSLLTEGENTRRIKQKCLD